MARIVIGGKYQNQILFAGNRRALPAHIRRIVTTYFNPWNALADITLYPNLMAELGDARADKFFPATEWEKLHALYTAQMQRFTLMLSAAAVGADGAAFFVRAPEGRPARPLKAVLDVYCEPDGRLRDSFNLWRMEKLLRRAKGRIKYDKSFTLGLKRFGARAISLEESVSFFRQIQAYHSADYLEPALADLLAPQLDALHTLRDPLQLPALGAQLREAGAHLRVEANTAPVLQHYALLAQVSAESGAGAQALPPVAQVLGDGALRARMYPYQREGVAFLVTNRRALLADDMGLGKTLQGIAAALYMRKASGLKRVLVICPASLKYQWRAEVQRFTGLRAEVIGGDPAEREDVYRAARLAGGGKAAAMFVSGDEMPFFYIVNYELVHRDLKQLKELDPGLLILDEAQRVKNFRTKTAQSVFDLPAPAVFVLTGTPLENQLMELFTIMKFIDPRPLGGNPLAFRDRYVVLDKFGGIAGYQHVEEVGRKIAAVTLRRTKEQALDSLPPLIETKRWLGLSDIQRRIYKELQGQTREILSQENWDLAASNNAMVLLQRLRETCDTPELIDPQHTESPKLTELTELLEDEVGALGRQALVFTQWTRMGEIMLRELSARGFEPQLLHGGLSARQRAELVERFQCGDLRVLLSTDAGGTGLNLQAASLVVNYDLPYNPARLAQRIARAHRIGQKGTVVVVNLLMQQTIEEKMLRLLEEKQSLFDGVFGEISDPERAAAPEQLSLREMLRRLVE